MIARRHFLHSMAAGAASLAGVAPAWAEPSGSYPQKPVRIIVPLPPGSPADVLARVVSDGLSRQWPEPTAGIAPSAPAVTNTVDNPRRRAVRSTARRTDVFPTPLAP